MPVSRKRKKKPGRSGRSAGSPWSPVRQRGSGVVAPTQEQRELAQALQGLTAHRIEIDEQRASRAAALAKDLVADLARVVADQPDVVVSDAFCQRLGALLSDEEQSPMDGVGPSHLAEALPAAAEAAVMAALTTSEPTDAWRVPLRLLTALTSVLPREYQYALDETITRVWASPAGRVLPATPPHPSVTGPVLWTSDRYGSRFAVTAPITAAEEGVRWYLWDIDACGHEAFTVHSGYYPTSEAALADWQTEVGPIASAGAVLAPVDDAWLLASLLPVEAGFLRAGGESVEQFAEYHRSKRLAEAVKGAIAFPRARPDAGLTATAAAAEFTAWLRARTTDQRGADLDELAGELADSWNLNDVDALYTTCSPHRVALCVLHVRNYYLDDFADQLVALMPDWTRWLAARNATVPELAERCVPYAEGLPHPHITDSSTKVNYLARIHE